MVEMGIGELGNWGIGEVTLATYYLLLITYYFFILGKRLLDILNIEG